jgi:tetratricopeptide (TPR) repeat protein
MLACVAGFTLGEKEAESIESSENQSRAVNREKRLQEHRIKVALREKLLSWLSDTNDIAAASDCDRLADSLLDLEEPRLSSYFIAAEVAILRQKSEKAISILKDVIKKHPDEKAPIGLVVPVRIGARFWIGTVARQSGDMAKAKYIYEKILEDLDVLENLEGREGYAAMCNLYLAEIDFQHFKRKDHALARLNAIQCIQKPQGPLGEGYDIFYEWAAYQTTRITRGKAQANQQLMGDPQITYGVPLMAIGQLLLSGITGEPLASSGGGMNVVTEVIVNRTIKNSASEIDRSLTRLGYGFDQQYKGNFAKAEKYYSALLEEDTFFSPVAGLYLAIVKNAKGNTTEAEATLERLKTKYPGYKSVAAKVKESWKKNTEKLKM